jgi:hypothetical protein
MTLGRNIKLKESSSILDAMDYLIFQSTPELPYDYDERVSEECPDYNKDDTQYSFSTPKGVPCSDCLYMIDLKTTYDKEVEQHKLAAKIIKDWDKITVKRRIK